MIQYLILSFSLYPHAVLELDRSAGAIHAHSQERVKVTVRPFESDRYHSKLTYQLLSSLDGESAKYRFPESRSI